MEFWGVEVKPGVPLKVKPDHGQLIHISQAALGEAVKDVKGAKNIPLRMKIDNKDFIIGSLKPEERTQLMFDLVFEREFELSHDWKNGSIYFIGYLAADSVSDDEVYSSDESEDEPLENVEKAAGNGVAKAAKAPAVAVKAETKKDESSNSDDDDLSEDGSDDEDLSLGGGSSDDLSGDDSEEDDSEEEELPPKNVQQSKKRPVESAQAAPVSAKKAKSATPEQTGNKKGQNTPGKNATGKTPPSDKSKQSPKSGGKFNGQSGNKSLNSKSGKGGKRGGK